MEVLKDLHTDGKLDHDLEAGAARVEELKAGRNSGDIPMTDEYWKALSYHNKAIQKRDEENTRKK